MAPMERIRGFWLGAVWLTCLGVVGGCFSLTIPEGKPCSAKGECPAGFVCGPDKRCFHADAATMSERPTETVPDRGDDLPPSDDGPSNCQMSVACTPSNPCHVGKACDSATGCIDPEQPQGDGTPCGDGSVCHSGSCVACSDAAKCQIPDQPCTAATTSCSTGVAVCVPSGNAPEGQLCGNNMVCSMGNCTTCNSGLTCTPI